MKDKFMEKKLYLAYGSNLSEVQMETRCPESELIGITDIEGYELTFRKSRTGHYATIDKSEGSFVPAAVWAISESDEANLDKYEGYPAHYQKVNLEINLFSIDGSINIEKVVAMIYVLPEERERGVPTDVYYDKLDKGYDRFGFNKKILIDALNKCK